MTVEPDGESRGMEEELRDLGERGPVRAAVRDLHDRDDETLDVQVELTSIAAPPFQEGRRAERLAELLTEAGLEAVRIDETGNVVADRPGTAAGPPLIVAAHLDTVFPEGTDVSVARDGPLLRGPGISDDGRGLAALVALARAMARAGIVTRTPLRFVGTVGEEGPGDLRGVKGYFGAGSARPVSPASQAAVEDSTAVQAERSRHREDRCRRQHADVRVVNRSRPDQRVRPVRLRRGPANFGAAGSQSGIGTVPKIRRKAGPVVFRGQ